MDIFKRGTKENLMFSTNKGLISIHDLWHMPLTSKNGFDLDTVWKSIKSEVTTVQEESLIVNPSPTNTIEKLKLNIVTEIITDRLAERDAATTRLDKSDKKAKLLAALAEQENNELKSKSSEDIRKMISELDD
jgi:hypothetical protein